MYRPFYLEKSDTYVKKELMYIYGRKLALLSSKLKSGALFPSGSNNQHVSMYNKRIV